MNFNLYNIKGIMEMNVAGYNNYPNCNYTIEEIQNLEKSKRINRMTVLKSKIEWICIWFNLWNLRYIKKSNGCLL